MKFIADIGIPRIKEAFSSMGEVQLLPAGEITPAVLKSADGLLVRTTTKITPTLMDGSGIKFVGTATIGTDHIDLPYLKNRGIHLSSAPGCNATAVAEYILTALLALGQKSGLSLQQRTLGIIGAGNTGCALKKIAEAMGIRCLLNDPPLAETSAGADYRTLDDLIRYADIISIHVPLTRTGRYPTFHLMNEAVIRRLNPGTIIINTSRGETLDGQGLKTNRERLGALILDVWENEPRIDTELLQCVDIATPHVAGYSLEGKMRATEMVYRDACDYFGLPATWKIEDGLSERESAVLTIHDGDKLPEQAVIQAYNIWEDDARLRLFPEQDNPGEYFAALRNQYRFRREFSSYRFSVRGPLAASKRKLLTQLGFSIRDG